VSTLVLKLVLTPALIGAASMAGRRWGPAVSGWLVGLPFTSAPITFFLALSDGTPFASTVALGTMTGTISQAAFCVTYGWLATRKARAGASGSWPGALLGGCVAFALATVALRGLAWSLVPSCAMVIAALLVALWLMPDASGGIATNPLPRWDLPARMVVATGFVLALTAIAPALGPRLTGLLAPFPLYAATLVVFAHHLQGPGPAANVLRGLLLGLFAFTGFFAVLAALLERAGIGPAFAAAGAVAIAIQSASLWALHRSRGLAGPAAGRPGAGAPPSPAST
jgi:hypothetical protein